METSSVLQRYRRKYQPSLPSILKDFLRLIPSFPQKKDQVKIDPELLSLFPSTHHLAPITFQTDSSSKDFSPLKVGVVLSGGQAPGGHNVIAGLFDALKKIHPESQLIGFLDGPSGIIQSKYIELTEEIVTPYRNQGGFDMIGSGRTKIETPEQFEVAGQTFKHLGLNGIVIIGGDDSNTNAAYLAEYCKQKNLPTQVIGVPKTIDGDLKNSFIETSFGFDTASKIYSEIIGNLAKDALSAKKYYFFVKMMGRSASHLTLECALQTHINMALIGEEIAHQRQTLSDVVEQITDLICERAQKNKTYGVILIPEGLLEFIPECQITFNDLNRTLMEHPSLAEKLIQKPASERLVMLKQYLSAEAFQCFSMLPDDIQKQLLLDRDPHGNIQLSKIETERFLITLVEKELQNRQQSKKFSWKFSPQPLFCGYEGRSGLPSNFDCNYCYSLGHVAALLVLYQASGCMSCIKDLTKSTDQWGIMGAPIVDMLHFEMRKNKRQAVIKKSLVDLEGPVFRAFHRERDKWRLNDLYSCPGPIQFDGPTEVTNQLPLTLILESNE